MLTLFDYLPSQNAWKVRQLLAHLERPYRSEIISIFEGAGQAADYLAINPTGAVPAIRLQDGRVLAESNAILWFLARDTQYLPSDPFDQAKAMQWLCFHTRSTRIPETSCLDGWPQCAGISRQWPKCAMAAPARGH